MGANNFGEAVGGWGKFVRKKGETRIGWKIILVG